MSARVKRLGHGLSGLVLLTGSVWLGGCVDNGDCPTNETCVNTGGAFALRYRIEKIP